MSLDCPIYGFTYMNIKKDNRERHTQKFGDGINIREHKHKRVQKINGK